MVGRDARHSGAAEGPAPPYRRAWTVRLEGQGPLKGPAVSDEAVVLLGTGSVVALEAASGEVRWEADREEGPAGPPAIAGDMVLYSSGQDDDAALVARRMDGGREEWSTPTVAAVPGGITVEGGRAFMATRSGQVLAIDAATGEVAWRFETSGNVGTSPAVADGLVLVSAQGPSSPASTLHAIDSSTGEEEWRFVPQGEASVLGTSPSAGADLVFAGLSDGQVHGLDLHTGAEQWSARPVPSIVGGPFGPLSMPVVPGASTVGEAAGLYVAGFARVARLETSTGNERWSYQLPSVIESSASLSGQYALFGDASGLAAAIDVRSGLLVWKQRLGPGPIGSFAVTPERIFVQTGAEDAVVVALRSNPEGSLLREESPTVLDPFRAVLSFLAAVATVSVLLLLLFRGPELVRRRSEART
jgi:outer membrane protein assembly factor BamB